jgi:hypothetical protein
MQLIQWKLLTTYLENSWQSGQNSGRNFVCRKFRVRSSFSSYKIVFKKKFKQTKKKKKRKLFFQIFCDVAAALAIIQKERFSHLWL